MDFGLLTTKEGRDRTFWCAAATLT